jgi:hypothetical protein
MSGSLLTKRILGGSHQVAKQLIALQSEDRQLLAIEFDAGLVKTVDEAAVAQPMLPDERIDSGDPKSAEIALLLFAVAVRVSKAFFERAASLPIQLAATDKARGQLQLALMSVAGFWSAFGTRHRKIAPPLVSCKTRLIARSTAGQGF